MSSLGTMQRMKPCSYSLIMWYTNTLIHRVVPGGWIQGGDIVDGSGSGGESIYGATFDGLAMKFCKLTYGCYKLQLIVQ